MATLSELKHLFAHRQPHDIAIEISGFTGFRTTLLEELTQEEIDRLYAIYRPMTPTQCEEGKKWLRSNILTIATKEGIHRPAMIEKNGKIVEDDWYHFNNWMLTYSTVHKLLFHCNVEELKAVHRQLCKLRDNNEKSAQKPFNQAWWRKGEKNKNLN